MLPIGDLWRVAGKTCGFQNMAHHRPKTAQSRAPRAASRNTCEKSCPKQAREARDAAKLARLGRFAHKATAAHLIEKHDAKLGRRISDCCRVAHSDTVELQAVKRPDGSTGSAFCGLVTCSSVWACPVCSARISEARKGELNHALAWARGAGHGVVMLTLTARHKASTELRPFLNDLKDAMKALRQSKGWRSLGLVGTIGATEVSHGANGWHPHGHWLLILPASAGDPVEAVERLRERWLACLAKLGRDGNQAAFHVQPASAAGEYVAKWGAGEELALSGRKLGRKGSRSPWQLLADAREGDKRAARLFVEYALAFKGKRQLHWSQGLKALCGLNEVPDDEADADAQAERVTVRTWFGSSEVWRSARLRMCALRDAVEDGGSLDAAEFGPADAVRWRRERQVSELIERESECL